MIIRADGEDLTGLTRDQAINRMKDKRPMKVTFRVGNEADVVKVKAIQAANNQRGPHRSIETAPSTDEDDDVFGNIFDGLGWVRDIGATPDGGDLSSSFFPSFFGDSRSKTRDAMPSALDRH